jgi:hypothetical protein
MNCSTVIDEVIALSLEIYTFLLTEAARFGPITVCCPGQSPAYIALAMKNLPIYDNNAVGIYVFPYSKGGCSTISLEERSSYGRALKSCGVVFRDNIYILDYVNSGAGINTFERHPYLLFILVQVKVRWLLSQLFSELRSHRWAFYYMVLYGFI